MACKYVFYQAVFEFCHSFMSSKNDGDLTVARLCSQNDAAFGSYLRLIFRFCYLHIWYFPPAPSTPNRLIFC